MLVGWEGLDSAQLGFVLDCSPIAAPIRLHHTARSFALRTQRIGHLDETTEHLTTITTTEGCLERSARGSVSMMNEIREVRKADPTGSIDFEALSDDPIFDELYNDIISIPSTENQNDARSLSDDDRNKFVVVSERCWHRLPQWLYLRQAFRSCSQERAQPVERQPLTVPPDRFPREGLSLHLVGHQGRGSSWVTLSARVGGSIRRVFLPTPLFVRPPPACTRSLVIPRHRSDRHRCIF